MIGVAVQRDCHDIYCDGAPAPEIDDVFDIWCTWRNSTYTSFKIAREAGSNVIGLFVSDRGHPKSWRKVQHLNTRGTRGDGASPVWYDVYDRTVTLQLEDEFAANFSAHTEPQLQRFVSYLRALGCAGQKRSLNHDEIDYAAKRHCSEQVDSTSVDSTHVTTGTTDASLSDSVDEREGSASEEGNAPWPELVQKKKTDGNWERIRPDAESGVQKTEGRSYRDYSRDTATDTGFEPAPECDTHDRDPAYECGSHDRYPAPECDSHDRYPAPECDSHDRYPAPECDSHDRYPAPECNSHDRYPEPECDSHDRYPAPECDSRDSHDGEYRRAGSLANMGNTCYLNAGVQAMRSLTEFIECLEENPPSTQVRIYDETLSTMRRLNSRDCMGPIEPRELRNAVAAEKTHLDHFLGMEQQDAHEFFIELVDRLHDDIKTLVEVCATDEHFTYQIDSTLLCTSCDYDRTKTEEYRNLPLSLAVRTTRKSDSERSDESRDADTGARREDYDAWSTQPIGDMDTELTSLNELWEKFFEPEQLEYRCEKCKGTESRVERSITRYPKVLSLQLKRFELSYVPSTREFSYIKMTDPIDIPDILRLEDNFYELRSVVCHEGSRPDCGHYTCWVRNSGNGPLWTLYNDSYIDTRDEFPDDIRVKAYLVFYVMQDPRAMESP